MAPRGRALVAGLTAVDPHAYGSAKTVGVEGAAKDADRMVEILAAQQFDVTCRKTESATAQALLDVIESASQELVSGDIFVFFFSGHGGQQADGPGGDEDDGLDETLLAFDRRIIDDELALRWARFAPGVRIVMISDSCTSGSNYWLTVAAGLSEPNAGAKSGIMQLVKPAVAVDSKDLGAMLIHMGAAHDGVDAEGGLNGGKFTLALYDTWNHGSYAGGYVDFFADLTRNLEGPTPVFNAVGPVTSEFLHQKPFTI